MLARLMVLGSAVIGGIIFADILIHPQGTQAAAQGVNTILTPTYTALLGG